MKTEPSVNESLLFSGLSENVKTAVISSARIKKWARGEPVVSEGDLCKGLFLVAKGVAAVQKYTPTGEYATICLLNAGDCFGEELFFSEEERYEYALEAVSDVEILSISSEQLQSLMDTYPELKENFGKVLSQKIRMQQKRITILSQKTVRQKIAYYLLSLSSDKKTDKVTLPVSKEVAAKYLAIPRPSFSRELSLMETEGLIRTSGRTIDIADVQALGKEIGDS